MSNETSPRLRCELCETSMTAQIPEGSPVRYYHCTGCGRWVASPYGEDVLRTGTARVESSGPEADAQAASRGFSEVKARLERWLTSLDERDPFRVLGLPPSANENAIRSRFRELALQNHPDHGGDPDQMRRVIAAYDRIRRGKRMRDTRLVVATAPAQPLRKK